MRFRLCLLSEVVIIWPEAAHLASLSRAVSTFVPGASTQLLDHYPDLAELTRLFGSGADRAAVVGLDGSENGVRTLEALKGLAPGVKPIAAAGDLDASSIRAAMRAGAVEFLAPPFDPEEIRRAFSQVFRSGSDARQGRVAGFVPARMGDGSSTIALHSAVSISESLGQPAILVDSDFECGTTSFRMGLTPSYTLVDAIARLDVLDDIWPQLAVDWHGAHVLPAPTHGPMLGDLQLEAAGDVVRAATARYPFACVDLPAALYPACGGLLSACDVVYVVCTPDLTSLHLAQRRLQRLFDAGISDDIVEIVVNRGGSRHAMPDKQIEESLSAPVARVLPNDYDAASEAALKSTTIVSSSRLGRALKSFAMEMAGVDAEPEQKSGGWARMLRLS